MNTPCVVGIDPGSAKCGVAVVNANKKVLWQGVVSTDSLIAEVTVLKETFTPVAVVIGSGTGSKAIIEQIRKTEWSVPLELVPEAHTTLLARERYLNTHPTKGWQRLLPRSLRTPPVAIDDVVAIILCERYWEGKSLPPSSSLP